MDPLGAVGDGGLADLETEITRRLPQEVTARLDELDALETSRPLTRDEVLEAMAIAWPAYFSSIAVPIAQRGHAPSAETWASICAELATLPEKLRGCAVPTRFVHGELDPLPVTASTDTAAIMGAAVDVRRSLELLRRAA